jgi:hypothetical protein
MFAMFVQTMVSNKFIGHGIVIGVFVLQAVLFSWGWENTLLTPGAPGKRMAAATMNTVWARRTHWISSRTYRVAMRCKRKSIAASAARSVSKFIMIRRTHSMLTRC